MRPPRRPGQSSLFALIALPVMLGALVLVLAVIRQRDTSTELRNAAVASALAAVADVADDALLTDDDVRIQPLFTSARAVAAAVGAQNIVEGQPLAVLSSDLVFGYHDPADGVVGSFRPLPASPTGAELGNVNAVRLTARHPFREGQFTRVTAIFDRRVDGFRPLPDRPAPLMPVALYDGPNEPDRPAWGNAVSTGPDDWAHSAGTPVWGSGQDGLREVTVRVGLQTTPANGVVCGFPVYLGNPATVDSVKQLADGVSEADLADEPVKGELRLNPVGWQLPVSGDPDLFESPPMMGDDLPLQRFAALATSGEVRVWPVFSGFDADGKAVLVGFTAARVVSAEREEPGGAILLKLQPAVIATPTALTRPERIPYDRSVGRVRIAG
jgi:hypothetical protein